MTPRTIEFAYRFCPACGLENPAIGSIPFRCERCGFCNFFGPVAAVGALVSRGRSHADRSSLDGSQPDEDSLLLVRRARDPGKGKWGLPGGFVDRDETVEQALTREVLEETRLKMTACQYLMSHPNSYNYRGIVVPVIDVFYVCQVESIESIELDRNELEHYEWVQPTLDHLEDMAFHSNRLAIEYWLSRR